MNLMKVEIYITYIYFNNKKELNTGSHPVSEILYVCEGLHPLSFV